MTTNIQSECLFEHSIVTLCQNLFMKSTHTIDPLKMIVREIFTALILKADWLLENLLPIRAINTSAILWPNF